MAARAPAVYDVKDVESADIQELYRLFLLEKAPALIGPNRESIPIPPSIYDILLQVIGYMSQGKAVSVVPIMQELTTQQAANLVGVSRPFFVEPLNRNELPFHRVGTHRRVYLKDVLQYRDHRDAQRKQILAEMANDAVSTGDYDQIYTPDSEE